MNSPEPGVLIREVGPPDGLQSVKAAKCTAAKRTWLEALRGSGLVVCPYAPGASVEPIYGMTSHAGRSRVWKPAREVTHE